MSLSQDDLKLLKFIGSISAVTGDDNCVPTLRRLVKKQDTPGALTEQHARIFTLLTTNEECKDLLFHYLNLVRVRSGKSPLDETAEPKVVDNFRKAIKVLQHFNNQADALVQASNLFAFLQGESPTVAEDAFDKLLSQDPSTALSLYRTRGTLPADKLSLVRAAAAGNKIAILRLADTSVVPDVVPPNLIALQQKEAELNAREAAFRKNVRTISSRLGLQPGQLIDLDENESAGSSEERASAPGPEGQSGSVPAPETPDEQIMSAQPEVIIDQATGTPAPNEAPPIAQANTGGDEGAGHDAGQGTDGQPNVDDDVHDDVHDDASGAERDGETRRAHFFLNSNSSSAPTDGGVESETE